MAVRLQTVYTTLLPCLALIMCVTWHVVHQLRSLRLLLQSHAQHSHCDVLPIRDCSKLKHAACAIATPVRLCTERAHIMLQLNSFPASRAQLLASSQASFTGLCVAQAAIELKHDRVPCQGP